MSNNICNHRETRREDWGTPKWLFDALNRIFKFSVDLAANMDNAKVERYMSLEDDFLGGGFKKLLMTFPDVFFHEKWAWCNPPYGRSGCGKWIEQIFMVPNTVSLIPASVGAKWFRQCWTYSTCIVFLHDRLRFDGAPCAAQFDCCLVVKGESLNHGHLRDLAHLGTVVPIWHTFPMIGKVA
jgi:phage N-6-adenine-methyltransferase